jgi:hypothetical protein
MTAETFAMVEAAYVVLEDASTDKPNEVYSSDRRWKALEYLARNYMDADQQRLDVAIAKRFHDDTYEIDG